MLQRFFELPVDKPELPADKRSLYQLLAAAATSIAIFQTLTGIGIFGIAALGATGYFDTPEQIHLLFLVAAITLFDGLLHLFPIFPLLRQERLSLVAILLIIINGTFSALQILLWQGVTWFPLAMVLSAIIILVSTQGLPNRYKITISAIGLAQLAFILIVNSQIPYQRLILSNLTNSAAFAIYLLFTTAMLVIGVINGLVNFQTLLSRLVSIFTTVTIITILVFSIIGSMVNYIDSRNRSFEQLETISKLKAAQINLVLENLQKQAAQPLTDTTISQIVQNATSSDPEKPVEIISIRLVRSYLLRLQQQTPNSEYLLADAKGRIIIATNPENENLDFSRFAFIESARAKRPFAIEKNFPGAGQEISLLALNPIFLQDEFAGVLVLRTDFRAINEVTSIAPGVNPTLETYMVSRVGGALIPTTATRQATEQIDTFPVQQAFFNQISVGQSAYESYDGNEVFGNYIWIPELESVLISEISQQEVVAGITSSLPVYLSIGLVLVLLVFSVVFTTSQSISFPLQDFAQKAASLASGALSIRVPSARQDEIGALAESFNKMAGELESTVRMLEAKVEERTKDLQKQANYMRIAAEVARDATTAEELDELLNRSIQLILDRFNFYHTGIFLIDNDREYAVLRASPTQAGRAMLEKGHRLKLGQIGLVGYVAATGSPRIALDTGQDTAYFNNPMLPNTRSEVAIPLKVGDNVLGVLDVQSTQPEAFTQDDVSTLQIMADQLALAIQRVELVNNLQRNFEELENTYRSFTVDSWKKFSQEREFKSGYTYDGLKITTLETFPQKIRGVLEKGRTAVLPPLRETEGTTVATPLKLREQVIGVLTLRFQTQNNDQDIISLIEETAGRLAVALENARLYAETQNLAQRERAVSEISSRIASSFNIENILRTAVMEIGKIVPDAEVVVELEQNKD